MTSSQGYFDYVLDLLWDVPDLTYRKMMGEYILYCQGKIIGGVYDDRLLLKDVPAAREVFSQEQLPYENATPQLLVDSEDPQLLAQVIEAMLPQLPEPKRAKRAKQ